MYFVAWLFFFYQKTSSLQDYNIKPKWGQDAKTLKWFILFFYMGFLSQTLLIHRIARKESGPFFSLYHPYPLTNSGIHLQSCIRYPLTNIQIFICSITFDIIDSLLCLIAVHIVTILLLSRIVLLLEITISMNLKFILYAC